jgi:hypothetical protein
MNAEKLKELREIAHRDSAVSLTVRAADLRALLDEVEALSAGLREIADQFGPALQDKLREWEGCGTEALGDPVYLEAVEAKHYHDIAMKYLVARHEPKDAE